MGTNQARSGLIVIFPRGRASSAPATMTSGPDRETMGMPEVVKPGRDPGLAERATITCGGYRPRAAAQQGDRHD